MQKLNFNVFKKEVSLVERIQFFISFFLRLTLLLACFLAIYTQNWLTFAIALGTLILTFVTAFFESRYKIELPSEFELIITIFIYASIYLGEVHEYYTVFWWWDLVLHTGSGIVLGFIGFIILFVMYRGRKVFAFGIQCRRGNLLRRFETRGDSDYRFLHRGPNHHLRSQTTSGNRAGKKRT